MRDRIRRPSITDLLDIIRFELAPRGKKSCAAVLLVASTRCYTNAWFLKRKTNARGLVRFSCFGAVKKAKKKKREFVHSNIERRKSSDNRKRIRANERLIKWSANVSKGAGVNLFGRLAFQRTRRYFTSFKPSVMARQGCLQGAQPPETAFSPLISTFYPKID